MPKYIILTAECDVDLERLVNNYIADGYKPVGGIVIKDGGTSRPWIQAVYKDSNE